VEVHHILENKIRIFFNLRHNVEDITGYFILVTLFFLRVYLFTWNVLFKNTILKSEENMQ